MTRSLLRLALLVALVLLAGCSGSGALSDDRTPDRDAYGVDDPLAPSLDEGESDEPATELVPGLTTDGVDDRGALLEAHEDVVVDRPYTIRYELHLENANGSWQYTVSRTSFVDPASGVVFQTAERSSDWSNESSLPYDEVANETVEFWSGDERLVRTELENGSVAYESGRHAGGIVRPYADPGQLLYPLDVVRENSTSVATTRATDGRYYVVGGSHANEIDDRDPNRGRGLYIEESAARLVVREDGLLRHSTLEQTAIDRGERLVATETFTIADVGETTVERPEWYDEALEATAEEPTDADEEHDEGDSNDERSEN